MTVDTRDLTLIFGYPDESEAFRKRHPLFLERFGHLGRAIDLAFTRVATMSGPEDKFVYFYGRLCAEDFMEILLVCGNGYGAAGMKLLRSLYEHAVTLRYLHEHPDEIEKFMDYHHIAQHKLMRAILDTMGEGAMPPSMVEDIKSRYAAVKNDFMVTACECGRKRLNHTWSKLDFVSMAKQTGDIGSHIVPGYFLPLRHSHSTVPAMTERLEIVGERMAFKADPQPDLSDSALMEAHLCILDVLRVQSEHFRIEGLQGQISICYQDYVDVWIANCKAPAPAGGVK